MADYADANSEERVSVHNGRPGDVAIRVVGDSMEPWYPAGTIVLVRPGARLRNGDGVIAILADGSVVFKTYVERKDTFLLLSINEDNGCKLEFKKSDHFAVRGIYLVVTSIRDEIKLRETMHASGKRHF
jgi:phage repressor protein C with HTH and peptisase S24 domain